MNGLRVKKTKENQELGILGSKNAERLNSILALESDEKLKAPILKSASQNKIVSVKQALTNYCFVSFVTEHQTSPMTWSHFSKPERGSMESFFTLKQSSRQDF